MTCDVMRKGAAHDTRTNLDLPVGIVQYIWVSLPARSPDGGRELKKSS